LKNRQCRRRPLRKHQALRYQCTGLLLYYSNRKNPGDYPGLLKRLEGIINFVFGDTD
jgi:hypothetical protein